MAKRHHSSDSDTKGSNTRENSTPPDAKIKRQGSKSLEGPKEIPFDEADYCTNLEYKPTEWLNEWDATVALIRDKKEKILSGNLTSTEKDRSVKSMLLAATNFRLLNRHIQYQLRKRRDEVKQISDQCDQEDVQLQNVIYEQKHLSMEADLNLKFKSRHHKFENLATEKEVIKNAGFSKEAIVELQNESHKMTVARLEYELKQRQKMRLELEQQKKNLRSRQNNIAQKDETLLKVDGQLEKILASTAMVCETFGIDTDKIQSINAQSAILSSSLAHLFKQISQQVEVKTYTCLKNPKIVVENENTIILSAEMNRKNTEFIMKFQETNGVNQSKDIQVACSMPHIAACLFQETEKYGYDEELETTSKVKFLKYHWCSSIAGIAKWSSSSDQLEPPQRLLREIDNALELNIANMTHLADYFLKKKFAPVSSALEKAFKGCKPFTKIDRFEEMNYDKFKNLSLSASVVKEGLARPSQKYFVGRLNRPDIGSKQVQLNFAVAIPYTVGVGCIFCIEQNARFTSNNKLSLRLIEGEINNNMEYCTDILADQMFYLAVLYDLLVETEAVAEGDFESITRSKNFNNDIASTAFQTTAPVYDPFTGVFTD